MFLLVWLFGYAPFDMKYLDSSVSMSGFYSGLSKNGVEVKELICERYGFHYPRVISWACPSSLRWSFAKASRVGLSAISRRCRGCRFHPSRRIPSGARFHRVRILFSFYLD